MLVAFAVDGPGFDHDILGFAAIGSAVHAQRPADGAGYTSQKG